MPTSQMTPMPTPAARKARRQPSICGVRWSSAASPARPNASISVEVVALDGEAGLLEDPGPRLLPATREMAALLEHQGVPEVECDGVNSHAGNLRPVTMTARPPSTREQHTRTPKEASGWEPGGLSVVAVVAVCCCLLPEEVA